MKKHRLWEIRLRILQAVFFAMEKQKNTEIAPIMPKNYIAPDGQ